MKKNYLKKNSPAIFLLVLILFNTALNGCSKSPDELYTEGKQLINKNETQKKGLKKLLRFEKKFPKDYRLPEVLLTIATVHHSQKNIREAVKTFEKLIEKFSHSSEAYKGKFLLGYLYYDEIKDSEKAVQIFQEFITVYPDSELTISAKILLENINLPVEEWSIVKKIEVDQSDSLAQK